MSYNPYTPYPQNPYGQPMYGFNQPQPQNQPQNENVYAFVNGVEGAKSFQIRPNQSVMLMDSENPVCYMKTSNAIGQASIRYFKLTEINENEAKGNSENTQSASNFVSKADFNALSDKVNKLYTIIEKDDKKAFGDAKGE